MGYASAMGWVLFLLILALTAIVLRSAADGFTTVDEILFFAGNSVVYQSVF
jgi:hypothetical protein